MFKLVTGSPGDGKTSNELWDFLHNDAYKGRPKYCTPVNGFVASDHGVTEIAHLKEWQSLPEGSVIFCDEVQDFAGTDLGRTEPEWIKQLARHRHHGYDFIVTTQSPMFLHAFVRKLAKPHVHYIRPWNMKGARYTWDTVQNDPNTRSAKAAGQRSLVTPNPEVFKLYTSTVLDTHKARPPIKLIITLILALLVLIGGSAYGVYSLKHISDSSKAAVEKSAGIVPSNVPTSLGDMQNSTASTVKPLEGPQWTEESMKPRIKGMPHTAPIYDSLTAPTDFPRVAGCISSKDRGTCKCYTQQATPVDVPLDACYVFIAKGTFDPWLSSRHQNQQQRPAIAETSQDTKPESQPLTEEQRLARGQSFTVVGDTSRGGRSVYK